MSRRKKHEPKNYSKCVITAMIILWFAVALFGAVIVCVQIMSGAYSSGIDGLFNFVGMPMTGGIVGYLVSKAVENREKIKANPDFLKNINKP